MKLQLSAFPTLGNYRLAALELDEVEAFKKQDSCAACGVESNWMPLARLGGASLEQGLVLRACQECTHVTYDRLPSEAWLADFYGRTWDEASRKRPPKRLRSRSFGALSQSPWSYIPHFKALDVQRDGRILDFGCGFGDGLAALQQLGYRNVFGVEVGTHRVSVAQKNLPGRVVIGSLEAAKGLRDQGGRFDVIILNHVAEHLGEPLAFLQELAPLLTDNGLLVVSVPNRGSESPIHLPLYFPHLHHFSPASLMSLFSRAGLIAHRWTGSDVQLAVAGTRDPGFQRTAFVAQRPSLSPSACEAVAQYVAAPWREGQGSQERICLNYFHPWLRSSTPSGFQSMSIRSERWLSRIHGAAPLVQAAENCGLDNHHVGRRIAAAAARALGREVPVGSEFLRFRWEKSMHSEDTDVPWLVGNGASVPVLAK